MEQLSNFELTKDTLYYGEYFISSSDTNDQTTKKYRESIRLHCRPMLCVISMKTVLLSMFDTIEQDYSWFYQSLLC